jgi:tetratricopeptide (TPR) repeat protein
MAGFKPTNPLQAAFIKLEEAERLRLEGKLKRAHAICAELLRKHPEYMAALHTLGLIYAGMDDHQQALNCLVRAAMLNPRSLTTLVALSGVYLDLEAREAAANTLEQARAIAPNDMNVLVTLGEIYLAEMEYEYARDAFREALEIEPDFYAANTGYGWACMFLGENEEATKVFERVLDVGPQSFEAFTILATMPSSLLSIDLLDELDKYAVGPRKGVDDPMMVTFVRAAALDKAGRHEEAWETVLPVNREMLAKMEDDVRTTRQRQANTLRLLRANSLDAAAKNVDETQPVTLFVLGPSRSGKTTMEGLVSRLDGVKCGYENPCVDTAIKHTFQGAGLLTNRFFEVLPPQHYPMCKDIYLDELKRRAGSAKVFTNTHPNRINDAAPISLVFPNIRFIFVKRNTEDIALRIFMRHYQIGNAYDMKLIYEHIAWYNDMMDLMAEKLPDAVRVIRYEDMVEDPAGALAVAAELCGLPMPDEPVPTVGDDRGCAEPYRDLIAAALRN